MSCGTESTGAKTEESLCCVEGKADYYELARKLALSGSTGFFSQIVDTQGAHTVEVDVEDLVHTGVYSVLVSLQYGSDAQNWTLVNLSPTMQFQAPGAKSGVVTGISARFVRLVYLTNGSGSARLSGGIRLRTEPPSLVVANAPLLPGLEAPLPETAEEYVLVADRLSVAEASSAYLPPISMADRNAVQLEITVIQTTSGLAISADIEASNDLQTWETLASYTGIAFGYSAPAAVSGISHRYVRVKVNGPQTSGPAEVAVGLTLSRQ